MFKDIRTWLIIGMALIISLLIIFRPQNEPDTEKIQALEMGIAHDKLKIKELEDKNKLESAAHVQEVTQTRDTLKRVQTHAGKLERSLARIRANPVIIQAVDDIQVLGEAFSTYDSLLESKDDQIELQGRLIVSLEDENKRITGNFMERLEFSEQNFIAQKAISDSYKKDLRKERRTNRLLKAGAVLLGVGGFFLGSQL